MAQIAVVLEYSPDLTAALCSASLVTQLTTSSASQSAARVMSMAMGLLIWLWGPQVMTVVVAQGYSPDLTAAFSWPSTVILLATVLARQSAARAMSMAMGLMI